MSEISNRRCKAEVDSHISQTSEVHCQNRTIQIECSTHSPEECTPTSETTITRKKICQTNRKHTDSGTTYGEHQKSLTHLSRHRRNTSTFQPSKHEESPRKTSRTNARKWQTGNLLNMTRFMDTGSNISPAYMKDWHNNSKVSWMISAACHHHDLQPEGQCSYKTTKLKEINRKTTDQSHAFQHPRSFSQES